MKQAAIFLADGFEETEAISTHDIFSRCGEIKSDMISIYDQDFVTTSMGLKVIPDAKLSHVDIAKYDFIVLPGGKKGVDNLKASKEVIAWVKKFKEEGKGVYAICAAPSILGELGYLDNKKYTCFPGFQSGKGDYINAPAVVDGDIITGHSMYFTLQFAEAIVEKEIGLEALKRIEHGTKGTEN